MIDLDYVKETADILGIEIELKEHTKETSSCREKADLLDWPIDRIVKALYYSNDDDYICVITPEISRSIPIKELVMQTQTISGKKAKKYRLNGTLDSMEYGTCSPFPQYNEFFLIKCYIINDLPDLEDHLVDISIGGKGEEAHKKSLHLPYNGIYQILRHSFNGDIYKISF